MKEISYKFPVEVLSKVSISDLCKTFHEKFNKPVSPLHSAVYNSRSEEIKNSNILKKEAPRWAGPPIEALFSLRESVGDTSGARNSPSITGCFASGDRGPFKKVGKKAGSSRSELNNLKKIRKLSDFIWAGSPMVRQAFSNSITFVSLLAKQKESSLLQRKEDSSNRNEPFFRYTAPLFQKIKNAPFTQKIKNAPFNFSFKIKGAVPILSLKKSSLFPSEAAPKGEGSIPMTQERRESVASLEESSEAIEGKRKKRGFMNEKHKKKFSFLESGSSSRTLFQFDKVVPQKSEGELTFNRTISGNQIKDEGPVPSLREGTGEGEGEGPVVLRYASKVKEAISLRSPLGEGKPFFFFFQKRRKSFLNKKEKNLFFDEKKETQFFKMPHRKPFTNYWLLPFIALITLIPGPSLSFNNHKKVEGEKANFALSFFKESSSARSDASGNKRRTFDKVSPPTGRTAKGVSIPTFPSDSKKVENPSAPHVVSEARGHMTLAGSSEPLVGISFRSQSEALFPRNSLFESARLEESSRVFSQRVEFGEEDGFVKENSIFPKKIAPFVKATYLDDSSRLIIGEKETHFPLSPLAHEVRGEEETLPRQQERLHKVKPKNSFYLLKGQRSCGPGQRRENEVFKSSQTEKGNNRIDSFLKGYFFKKKEVAQTKKRFIEAFHEVGLDRRKRSSPKERGHMTSRYAHNVRGKNNDLPTFSSQKSADLLLENVIKKQFISKKNKFFPNESFYVQSGDFRKASGASNAFPSLQEGKSVGVSPAKQPLASLSTRGAASLGEGDLASLALLKERSERESGAGSYDPHPRRGSQSEGDLGQSEDATKEEGVTTKKEAPRWAAASLHKVEPIEALLPPEWASNWEGVTSDEGAASHTSPPDSQSEKRGEDEVASEEGVTSRKGALSAEGTTNKEGAASLAARNKRPASEAAQPSLLGAGASMGASEGAAHRGATKIEDKRQTLLNEGLFQIIKGTQSALKEAGSLLQRSSPLPKVERKKSEPGTLPFLYNKVMARFLKKRESRKNSSYAAALSPKERLGGNNENLLLFWKKMLKVEASVKSCNKVQIPKAFFIFNIFNKEALSQIFLKKRLLIKRTASIAASEAAGDLATHGAEKSKNFLAKASIPQGRYTKQNVYLRSLMNQLATFKKIFYSPKFCSFDVGDDTRSVQKEEDDAQNKRFSTALDADRIQESCQNLLDLVYTTSCFKTQKIKSTSSNQMALSSYPLEREATPIVTAKQLLDGRLLRLRPSRPSLLGEGPHFSPSPVGEGEREREGEGEPQQLRLPTGDSTEERPAMLPKKVDPKEEDKGPRSPRYARHMNAKQGRKRRSSSQNEPVVLRYASKVKEAVREAISLRLRSEGQNENLKFSEEKYLSWLQNELSFMDNIKHPFSTIKASLKAKAIPRILKMRHPILISGFKGPSKSYDPSPAPKGEDCFASGHRGPDLLETNPPFLGDKEKQSTATSKKIKSYQYLMQNAFLNPFMNGNNSLPFKTTFLAQSLTHGVPLGRLEKESSFYEDKNDPSSRFELPLDSGNRMRKEGSLVAFEAPWGHMTALPLPLPWESERERSEGIAFNNPFKYIKYSKEGFNLAAIKKVKGTLFALNPFSLALCEAKGDSSSLRDLKAHYFLRERADSLRDEPFFSFEREKASGSYSATHPVTLGREVRFSPSPSPSPSLFPSRREGTGEGERPFRIRKNKINRVDKLFRSYLSQPAYVPLLSFKQPGLVTLVIRFVIDVVQKKLYLNLVDKNFYTNQRTRVRTWVSKKVARVSKKIARVSKKVAKKVARVSKKVDKAFRSFIAHPSDLTFIYSFLKIGGVRVDKNFYLNLMPRVSQKMEMRLFFKKNPKHNKHNKLGLLRSPEVSQHPLNKIKLPRRGFLRSFFFFFGKKEAYAKKGSGSPLSSKEAFLKRSRLVKREFRRSKAKLLLEVEKHLDVYNFSKDKEVEEVSYLKKNVFLLSSRSVKGRSPLGEKRDRRKQSSLASFPSEAAPSLRSLREGKERSEGGSINSTSPLRTLEKIRKVKDIKESRKKIRKLRQKRVGNLQPRTRLTRPRYNWEIQAIFQKFVKLRHKRNFLASRFAHYSLRERSYEPQPLSKLKSKRQKTPFSKEKKNTLFLSKGPSSSLLSSREVIGSTGAEVGSRQKLVIIKIINHFKKRFLSLFHRPWVFLKQEKFSALKKFAITRNIKFELITRGLLDSYYRGRKAGPANSGMLDTLPTRSIPKRNREALYERKSSPPSFRPSLSLQRRRKPLDGRGRPSRPPFSLREPKARGRDEVKEQPGSSSLFLFKRKNLPFSFRPTNKKFYSISPIISRNLVALWRFSWIKQNVKNYVRRVNHSFYLLNEKSKKIERGKGIQKLPDLFKLLPSRKGASIAASEAAGDLATHGASLSFSSKEAQSSFLKEISKPLDRRGPMTPAKQRIHMTRSPEVRSYDPRSRMTARPSEAAGDKLASLQTRREFFSGRVSEKNQKWNSLKKIHEYNDISYNIIQEIITRTKPSSRAFNLTKQRAFKTKRRRSLLLTLRKKNQEFNLINWVGEVVKAPSTFIRRLNQSYSENPYLTILNFGNMAKKRIYWAVNKTNVWQFKNLNHKQYLWKTVRFREDIRGHDALTFYHKIETLVKAPLLNEYSYSKKTVERVKEKALFLEGFLPAKQPKNFKNPPRRKSAGSHITPWDNNYTLFLQKQSLKEKKMGDMGFLEYNDSNFPLINSLFSLSSKANLSERRKRQKKQKGSFAASILSRIDRLKNLFKKGLSPATKGEGKRSSLRSGRKRSNSSSEEAPSLREGGERSERGSKRIKKSRHRLRSSREKREKLRRRDPFFFQTLINPKIGFLKEHKSFLRDLKNSLRSKVPHSGFRINEKPAAKQLSALEESSVNPLLDKQKDPFCRKGVPLLRNYPSYKNFLSQKNKSDAFAKSKTDIKYNIETVPFLGTYNDTPSLTAFFSNFLRLGKVYPKGILSTVSNTRKQFLAVGENYNSAPLPYGTPAKQLKERGYFFPFGDGEAALSQIAVRGASTAASEAAGDRGASLFFPFFTKEDASDLLKRKKKEKTLEVNLSLPYGEVQGKEAKEKTPLDGRLLRLRPSRPKVNLSLPYGEVQVKEAIEGQIFFGEKTPSLTRFANQFFISKAVLLITIMFHFCSLFAILNISQVREVIKIFILCTSKTFNFFHFILDLTASLKSSVPFYSSFVVSNDNPDSQNLVQFSHRQPFFHTIFPGHMNAKQSVVEEGKKQPLDGLLRRPKGRGRPSRPFVSLSTRGAASHTSGEGAGSYDPPLPTLLRIHMTRVARRSRFALYQRGPSQSEASLLPPKLSTLKKTYFFISRLNFPYFFSKGKKNSLRQSSPFLPSLSQREKQAFSNKPNRQENSVFKISKARAPRSFSLSHGRGRGAKRDFFLLSKSFVKIKSLALINNLLKLCFQNSGPIFLKKILLKLRSNKLTRLIDKLTDKLTDSVLDIKEVMVQFVAFIVLDRVGGSIDYWLGKFFSLELTLDLATIIPEEEDIFIWKNVSKNFSYLKMAPILGTLLEKRLLSTFEAFWEKMTKLDADLLHRENQGRVTFLFWCEMLRTFAEENAIFLPLIAKPEYASLVFSLGNDYLNASRKELQASRSERSEIAASEAVPLPRRAASHTSHVVSRRRGEGEGDLSASSPTLLRTATLAARTASFPLVESEARGVENSEGDDAGIAVLSTLQQGDKLLTQYSQRTKRSWPYKIVRGQGTPNHYQTDDPITTKWKGWSVQTTLKSEKIHLIIQAPPPPRSFKSLNPGGQGGSNFLFSSSLRRDRRTYSNAERIRIAPFHLELGTIICQIYSGSFIEKVTQNFLVIGSNVGLDYDEKNVLIGSLAGETEMSIIRFNAGLHTDQIGMRLLRNLFSALPSYVPFIFLIEDVHLIGVRRPFLGGTQVQIPVNKSSELNLEDDVSGYDYTSKNNYSVMRYKKPSNGEFYFLTPAGVKASFDLFLVPPLFDRTKDNGFTPLNPIPSYSLREAGENGKAGEDGEDGEDGTNPSPHRESSFFDNSVVRARLESSLTQPDPRNVMNSLNYRRTQLGAPSDKTKSSIELREKIARLANLIISNLYTKFNIASDFLEILEEVPSNSGFMLFATTDSPSSLDPAFRRPGRLEKTILLSFTPKLGNRWGIVKSNFPSLNAGPSFFHTGLLFKAETGFPLGLTVDFLDYGLFNPSLSSLDLLTLQIQKKLSTFSKNSRTRGSSYKRSALPLASLLKESERSERSEIDASEAVAHRGAASHTSLRSRSLWIHKVKRGEGKGNRRECFSRPPKATVARPEGKKNGESSSLLRSEPSELLSKKRIPKSLNRINETFISENILEPSTFWVRKVPVARGKSSPFRYSQFSPSPSPFPSRREGTGEGKRSYDSGSFASEAARSSSLGEQSEGGDRGPSLLNLLKKRSEKKKRSKNGRPLAFGSQSESRGLDGRKRSSRLSRGCFAGGSFAGKKKDKNSFERSFNKLESPLHLIDIAYYKIGKFLVNKQFYGSIPIPTKEGGFVPFFSTLHARIDGPDFFEDEVSPYLPLFQKPENIKLYLMSLFAPRVSSSMAFSNRRHVHLKINLKKKGASEAAFDLPSLALLKERSERESGASMGGPFPSGGEAAHREARFSPKGERSYYPGDVSAKRDPHFFLNGFSNSNLIGKGSEAATSLISTLIEKRFIYKKNVMIPKLLQYYNGAIHKSSLQDEASSPNTVLLLPAKRYENYKRSFFAMQFFSDSVAQAFPLPIESIGTAAPGDFVDLKTKGLLRDSDLIQNKILLHQRRKESLLVLRKASLLLRKASSEERKKSLTLIATATEREAFPSEVESEQSQALQKVRPLSSRFALHMTRSPLGEKRGMSPFCFSAKGGSRFYKFRKEERQEVRSGSAFYKNPKEQINKKDAKQPLLLPYATLKEKKLKKGQRSSTSRLWIHKVKRGERIIGPLSFRREAGLPLDGRGRPSRPSSRTSLLLIEKRSSVVPEGFEIFAAQAKEIFDYVSHVKDYYQNRIFNRHRGYLISQWWNGHLSEHNSETVFGDKTIFMRADLLSKETFKIRTSAPDLKRDVTLQRRFAKFKLDSFLASNPLNIETLKMFLKLNSFKALNPLKIDILEKSLETLEILVERKKEEEKARKARLPRGGRPFSFETYRKKQGPPAPLAKQSFPLGAGEGSSDLEGLLSLPEVYTERTEKSMVKDFYTYASRRLKRATKTTKVNDSAEKMNFPDFDQHYNPTNRRWVLHSGYWNYWYNFKTANNSEIYSYLVTESYFKTFNFLNSNREILDYFAAKIVNSGLVNEMTVVNAFKRFPLLSFSKKKNVLNT